MFALKLERREAISPWLYVVIPFLAIGVTLVFIAGLVWLSGVGLVETFYYFFLQPLTSRFSILEVLVKSTPLLLTGTAVALAFSASYWNIGAEGQLYAGAVAAAWCGIVLHDVSAFIGIPAVILCGALAGALWALVPAWLKTRWAVDEVVTTLLLNSIMLFIVSALLNGPWRDPITHWPQSPTIAAATQFPRLLPRSRLHLGFAVALGTLVCLWWGISRMSFGLKVRAVGRGREAARFVGIKVQRVTFAVALLSGAIAGLAGAGEVAGIHYHLIEAISPGYGYSGIVVATLGNLHPLGVGLAALFIGLITTGAQTASRALGVPVFLGEVIQAVLLLTMLAMLLLRIYRVRWS